MIQRGVRGRNGSASISSWRRQVDGAGNAQQDNCYPNTVVKHVVLEESDYAMLVLSTEVVQPHRKRQFMYDP